MIPEPKLGVHRSGLYVGFCRHSCSPERLPVTSGTSSRWVCGWVYPPQGPQPYRFTVLYVMKSCAHGGAWLA